MASFFQPPLSGDPAIVACGNSSRFQVYCNNFLSSDERLQTWEQYFTLTVAIAALSIPLILTILLRAASLVKGIVRRRTHRRIKRPKWDTLQQNRRNFQAFASVQSFHFLDNSYPHVSKVSLRAHERPESHVFLIPLPSYADQEASYPDILASRRTTSHDSGHHGIVSPEPEPEPEPKLVLGLVDLNAISPTAIPVWVNFLINLHREGRIAGVALRATTPSPPSPATLDATESLLAALLPALATRSVPALLSAPVSSPLLLAIDLSLLAGIIVQNACVLPSGERRDYFRSQRLREVMGRAAAERTARDGGPEKFFVGFHDVWDTRPSAAVVYRAGKVARHFGAVFEHGPRQPGEAVGNTSSGTEEDQERRPDEDGAERQDGGKVSMSGFEFLRRAETTELQRVWVEGKRGLHVDPPEEGAEAFSGEVERLDLGPVRAAIPNIDSLLAAGPLAADLEALRSEKPELVQLPDLGTLSLPVGGDFWESSASGGKISSLGCVPLTSPATSHQYDAIVETQTHLCELKMLHRLEDAETTKIIYKLQTLLPRLHHKRLAEQLIDGLVNGRIAVFKGLGTGFTLPDNIACFWGVSAVRREEEQDYESDPEKDGGRNQVDIFISRRNPNDAVTVLHTWLAHHGVPRVHRFEEELMLERHDTTTKRPVAPQLLPQSIMADLNQCSPSEILHLLYHLRLSHPATPFKSSIEQHCQHILLAEASSSSWTTSHGHGYLSGSIPMSDLLQQRLIHYAHLGATRLPSLPNLLRLHALIDGVISRALYAGDRATLLSLSDTSLLRAYDPWNSQAIDLAVSRRVDINADIIALLFFCALRKAALEDVYLEATDRCPLFLSQPDQAAVFSELWVLGSQCEVFFQVPPRKVGEMVYARYRTHLERNPPGAGPWDKGCIMAVYAKEEKNEKGSAGEKGGGGAKEIHDGRERGKKRMTTPLAMTRRAKTVLVDLGALSIFCLPAMIDIVLLSFVGRGLFMTAFMSSQTLSAACYGLLTSLLLSAGVTGWVGSGGNYYLSHYAYNNMVFFHIQRLSGAFVLTGAVGLVGIVIYCFKRQYGPAFVFLAYLVLVTIYLTLLGIMATMHQNNSPFTSGRTVLWRTIPVLFLSPIISTLIPNHDLQIYIPVGYGFLLLLLYQYRSLCHEWVSWTDNIPRVGEKDVVEWYASKKAPRLSASTTTSPRTSESDDPSATAAATVPALHPVPLQEEEDESPEEARKNALVSFRNSVEAHRKTAFHVGESSVRADRLVAKVARGLPYIAWLLKKGSDAGEKAAEPFSIEWFAQFGQAVRNMEQMTQGIKEHSVFMLFRHARYDIGQSVGLFLICLMDRWVSIIMSARGPAIPIFIDGRSRYAVCFAILYFCGSVMTLDTTLRKHWLASYSLSEERLSSVEQARAVARVWERSRKRRYATAILELSRNLLIVAGCTTIFVWLLVDSTKMFTLYYAYLVGYTAVIVFQFNRCFTTNSHAHVTAILVSAAIGFVTGCTIHGVWGNAFFYTDVVALNAAAVSAAFLTSVLSWKDFRKTELTKGGSSGATSNQAGELGCFQQLRLSGRDDLSDTSSWVAIPGERLVFNTAAYVAQRLPDLLRLGIEQPSVETRKTAWAEELLYEALGLWYNAKLDIIMSNRSAFLDAGFGEAASFSRLNGDTLEITIGCLGKEEVDMPSWQSTLAEIAAEAVLYHTARVVLDMPVAMALHAEHFLSHSAPISKRLELQIATDDSATVQSIKQQLRVDLVRHLSLGVNVDIQWATLPPSARDAIMNRVLGQPLARSSNFKAWVISSSASIETSDFLVHLCQHLLNKSSSRLQTGLSLSPSALGQLPAPAATPLHCYPIRSDQDSLFSLRRLWKFLTSIPVGFTKWVAIISGGGSDIERELWYALRHWPSIRSPIMRVLLVVWRACWHLRNGWIWIMLIHHRKAVANISRMAKEGAARKLYRNTIVVEMPRKTITGFATRSETGSLVVDVFPGKLSERPATDSVASKAIYDEHLRLVSRSDSKPGKAQKKGKVPNAAVSVYSYSENVRVRWPISKDFEDEEAMVRRFYCYDRLGRVACGTVSFGERKEEEEEDDAVETWTEYSFRYYYKSTPGREHDKTSHDLLKAEFSLVQPPASGHNRNDRLTVYWGVPLRKDQPLDPRLEDEDACDWVPSDRVYRVVRQVAGKTYVTTSDYQHRRDPTMRTYLLRAGDSKSAAVTTAPTAIPTAPKVFAHDSLLEQRPSDVSFEDDDLLIHHPRSALSRIAKFSSSSSTSSSSSSSYSTAPTAPPLSTLLHPSAWLYRWVKHTVYLPVPTWWLRTELWNRWLRVGSLDAIAACWADELILREEPLLRRYWAARNRGQLSRARHALDGHIDQIIAAIEMDRDVSEVCMLPIKSADLYAMGLGKDATQMTARPDDCYRSETYDSGESNGGSGGSATRRPDRVSVVFNDIGCWPEAPGGVSNCRRDLVNGHGTVRNHVLAESASEFGTPRFQVEKSVQSLKILPLWGLDGRTAHHGLLDNLLQGEVDGKIRDTDARRDVAGTFVPLLRAFVRGARSRHLDRRALVRSSEALMTMFRYFEHKDYGVTWDSPAVFDAWVEAWLEPADRAENNRADMIDPSQFLELEKPSMTDFRATLAIFKAYFFIFSVQTPEDCPQVFQSTHHGISSLFGMLLKHRRGATFGIWDHAILWRESCLNISPAQTSLPVPVQTMLLAGFGLAMRVAYFHADVVLPCTPVFNPVWESALGTDSGLLGPSQHFTRKIDPIVNGVSNMAAFKPVEEVQTSVPTVIMLSNVQFIKDIRTAILAADFIVNRYGFHDYRLHIYGAKDREPAYAIDMARLIASCNLAAHVELKGFGRPDEILKDAWLFLNSSISEGLPLAIAEAALAGVPIVATAVGATALVLTDPDDPSLRYGEVVPPNDAAALARAQVALLAMAGPTWGRFAAAAAATAEVNKTVAAGDGSGSAGDGNGSDAGDGNGGAGASSSSMAAAAADAAAMPDELTAADTARLTKRMYEMAGARKALGMKSREVVLKGFHGERYLREHEQMYWIQWHWARMRRDDEVMRGGPSGGVDRRGLTYGGEDVVGKAANAKGFPALRRIKSGRWQEFKSTKYQGRRLSKRPVGLPVEEVLLEEQE